jgi:dephospho-CoA kinase
VYDCDAAAKRLMRCDPEIKSRLTALVGSDAYIDGSLNKAAIAQFIMAGEENVGKVNSIVHPAVARDFINSGMKWMECAILFESGFQQYVDVVVCVTAPLETRIRRVVNRDGISTEKALEWMARQWPQEQVAAHSHFIIVNDGITDIDPQINRLFEYLGETEQHF